VVVAVLALAGLGWWARSGSRDHAVDRGGGSAVGVVHARGHAVAPAARRITGIVLLDGDPAAGAEVRAIRGGFVEPVVTVASGADGRFELQVTHGDRFVIAADKAGAIGASAELDLGDPTAPAEVTLMLHACTATVHGTVRDASGGVIARAIEDKPPGTAVKLTIERADKQQVVTLTVAAP
jgi:hypothetical protein